MTEHACDQSHFAATFNLKFELSDQNFLNSND